MFASNLLEGRVALVTGGGTGICRGIALAFAAHGCDVAITSRKIEHLEPTAAELRATGRRAIAKAADVRDPAAIGAVVEATVAELGRLDILINGAAGNFICLAENLSPNGFGTVVDIDLKGTFHASNAALPHLRLAADRSSTSARRCTHLGTIGAVARGGGEGRHRLAHAHAGVRVGTVCGIRVNGIAPGSDRRHRGRARG